METRERIVEAARELFMQRGYEATSVAAIRKKAGVHSGSLYHYFASKKALLNGVLRSYRDGIGPGLLEPAWRGVEDPFERIFALLGAYRRNILATNFEYGCPIGNIALEIHQPESETSALLAANFDNWIDAVEHCLLEAGDRVTLPGTPRAVGEFVLSIMEGAVMQARVYRDISVFDRNVNVLRKMLDGTG